MFDSTQISTLENTILPGGRLISNMVKTHNAVYNLSTAVKTVASAQLGAPEIRMRSAFVRKLPAFDIVAINPDTGDIATFYCSVDAEHGLTVPEGGEKLISVERSGLHMRYYLGILFNI